MPLLVLFNKIVHFFSSISRNVLNRTVLPSVIDVLLNLKTGKVDEKATQLHAIASLKVLLEATRPTAGGAGATAARHSAVSAAQAKETPLDLPNGGLADIQLDAIEEVSFNILSIVMTLAFQVDKACND